MNVFRALLPDRRALAAGLLLAIAVGIAAYVCILFSREQGRIAPIWIANALVVAALLRSPTGRWPTLVAAAFGAYVTANLAFGDPPVTVLALATCNLLEYVGCAAFLRHRCGRTFDIGRIRHLGWFIVAAIVASTISAGLASLFLGLTEEAGYLAVLRNWIQADALGLLTFAPCLLVLSRRGRAAPTPVWRESWTLVVLTAVSVVIFFVTRYPLLFVVSAALILPTWRMGLPGALAGTAIMATMATAATFTGHGPFLMAGYVDQVIGLQLFVAVAFLTSVPLAAARDESERLKARLKSALVKSRTARHEAERAAQVKSEFLANMSHELRTPLTSVVGFTRLVGEQPDLSPLSRRYVDRVGDASRALLCTVNDILDFSKLEAGQVSFRPEPTEPGPLASRTLDLFTPQAGAKDVALVLDDQTGGHVVVTVDPDRLRQVLLNLVGNAVKFTSSGSVTLTVRYDEAAEQLWFAVADTGPGIPPERMDRLFKRFSQVDGSLTREYGGTGLGLAICKGIVEAMGGAIGVESAVGEGSTFSFSLPAARTFTAPASLENGPDHASAGLRLLVVDDHPANRELVRLFLAAVGADVVEAGDGQEAVELAARQPFDVILMDLRMPRLDGASALGRIRAGDGPNKTTPVLAFTADADTLSRSGLADLSFSGTVAKPVEPGPLLEAIFRAAAPAEEPAARLTA